jgi:threonine synthase
VEVPTGPLLTTGQGSFSYDRQNRRIGTKEAGVALEALRCKECGSEYPLDARYVCESCFGPLEVAYDFSTLDPEEARRRIQAGSAGIWR